MNWSKVEGSKAWGLLNRWVMDTYGTMFGLLFIADDELVIMEGYYESDNKILEVRALYDFFDANGIRVVIAFYTDAFYVEIYRNNISGESAEEYFLVDEEEVEYGSRIEAEEVGFIKAFEILNNKL